MKKQHPFSLVLTTYFKLRVIKKLIKAKKGDRLLDIGCGSGYSLNQLKDKFKEKMGIDISPESLKMAKKYTQAKLIKGNAAKLPFRNNYFDWIISLDAFEHIKDNNKAIKEVYRTLKQKGFFIIYVPCKEGVLAKTRFAGLFHNSCYLKDYHLYSKKSLENLILKSGFKIKYLGYHNVFFQEFFTQILKGISRLLGKKYETQADINNFVESSLYPIYRWLIFPLCNIIITGEEFLTTVIAKNRFPGHRLVCLCQKE